MSNLFDILNTVSNALKDDKGFDLAELDKAVVELHLKLSGPQWAVKDEALRSECEKLVVSWAVKRYFEGASHPRLAQKEVSVSVDIPDTKDVSKVTYNGQEIPLDGSIKMVKEAKDE